MENRLKIRWFKHSSLLQKRCPTIFSKTHLLHTIEICQIMWAWEKEILSTQCPRPWRWTFEQKWYAIRIYFYCIISYLWSEIFCLKHIAISQHVSENNTENEAVKKVYFWGFFLYICYILWETQFFLLLKSNKRLFSAKKQKQQQEKKFCPPSFLPMKGLQMALKGF